MLNPEQLAVIEEIDAAYFNGLVGITFLEQSPDRSIAKFELREHLYQPFGFLHGGATLTLLEAVASRCAALRTDFTCERPFGIHVDVCCRSVCLYRKRLICIDAYHIVAIDLHHRKIGSANT